MDVAILLQDAILVQDVVLLAGRPTPGGAIDGMRVCYGEKGGAGAQIAE